MNKLESDRSLVRVSKSSWMVVSDWTWSSVLEALRTSATFGANSGIVTVTVLELIVYSLSSID